MSQLNSHQTDFRSRYFDSYPFIIDEDDRYQSLVENLSIGIVVHEASTRILFANSAACLMLGLCKNEVEEAYATDPQWHFIEEDGRTMTLDRFPVYQVIKLKSRMPSLVLGIEHSQKDHTTWVYCDGYPILDAKGDLIQVIVNFTDITKRIYLEKELIKAKAAKARFIDIAAHELKNPVAALSAQVELTIRRLSKGHPVDVASMEKILRQTNRVSNLVVSLLDVSRLEKNAIRLKKEKINLVSLIQENIQDFELACPQCQISFMNSEGPSVFFNLDRDRFSQVLNNLLDNANKYSDQKPVTIELSGDAETIRISVADQGEEIPASIQEDIFKPFIRGEDKLKSTTPGLGLGLYICRSIVELHGGRIGLNRSSDQKNIFYIELPRGQS